MRPVFTKTLQSWLPLIAVLAVAICVRIIFFAGLARGGDALNYAHTAFAVSRGWFDFGAWPGMAYVGLYAPVAFLYWLLGVNDLTTLALPFASSLATLLIIYLIARRFADETAGLISACLWAFFPLDVYLATSLVPDGLLAALVTAAVYIFLLGEDLTRGRTVYYTGSAMLWVLAVLVKPLALAAFFVPLAIIAFRIWPMLRKKTLASLKLGWLAPRTLAAAFFLLLVAYHLTQSSPFILIVQNTSSDLKDFLFTGSAQLDFGDTDFFRSDLLIFFAPLLAVSFFSLLSEKKRSFVPLLVWAAVLFLAYEWMSTSLNPFFYNPLSAIQEARNMLFVFPPFVAVAGVFLGRPFKLRGAGWMIVVITLAAFFATLLLKPLLVAEGNAWPTAIALFALVLGSLAAAPIFMNAGQRLKIATILLVLASFCVGMLQPFLPYHALMHVEKADLLRRLRATTPFWQTHPEFPVYSSNALLLNYATGFSLGYDWLSFMDPTQPARINAGQGPGDASAYIVLEASDVPLANWWQQYESPEGQLKIFRVLEHEQAATELLAASAAVRANSSQANQVRLFGAQVNALDWQGLFATWVILHTNDPSAYPLTSIELKITQYLQAHPGLLSHSVLRDPAFEHGFQYWNFMQQDRVRVSPEGLQLMVRQGDALTQSVVLQPNQLYYFQANIATKREAAPEVLSLPDIPDTLSTPFTSEFPTQVSSIFVTPDWPGPQELEIALFIAAGSGQILISEPVLIPLIEK